MDEVEFAGILGSLKVVLDSDPDEDGRWFFSFGTMLYFFRDKNMGIPLWGDIDVSVLDVKIDADQFAQNMREFGFKLKTKIVDSRNGSPFQMVFGHEYHKGYPDIDIFFWRKGKQCYYHSYDYYMEKPKGGVPSKYVFKGTPTWALKGKPVKYIWLEIAAEMNFPPLYGTLLDIWYPEWFIPDKNFGQSKAVKEVKVKNCQDLEGKLL